MSIETVLLIVAVIEIATLYRVEWVYRVRRVTLDLNGFHDYCRPPAFIVMVGKFWVWNADAFLRKEGQ